MTRQVRTSPSAGYDLGYHVVWCPVLGGRVKTRPAELVRAALEVMPDHVHLSVKPYPKNSPSYVANQFKGFTSHRLRAAFGHLHSQLPTLWSRSCFVATVGAVSTETVQRYIETRYARPSKGGGRA